MALISKAGNETQQMDNISLCNMTLYWQTVQEHKTTDSTTTSTLPNLYRISYSLIHSVSFDILLA